jgi:hypothetical protein
MTAVGMGLVADESTARRGGMTLVRLRDGVYADGSAVDRERGVPSRVVHLIASECIGLDPEEKMPWEKALPAAVTCCGVTFQPGTLEEVPWGTEWPHRLCVQTAPQPRSYIERHFLDAQQVPSEHEFDEKAYALGSATLRDLLGKRAGWELVEDTDENDVWSYTTSFQGVFTREQRFPRGRDLGLELLEITRVGNLDIRLDTCGVQDGCPDHLSRIEMFTLPGGVASLEKQLAPLEQQASSILLPDLMWCLFAGPCSQQQIFDPLF